MCSIWNSTFLGRSSVAVLPYCQALSKFPSHIQQARGQGLVLGLCGTAINQKLETAPPQVQLPFQGADASWAAQPGS